MEADGHLASSAAWLDTTRCGALRAVRQLAESSVERLNIVMEMTRQRSPKMLGCAVARRDRRPAVANIRRDAAVHRRFLRAGALPVIRSAALIAAAIAAAGFLSASASAQTLADPNPPPKWSPPPAAQPGAKAKPAARVKSCSAYGAGFVNLPGTDACVKIGGWVEVEGSTSR
jgi:hypothetical protein